LDLANIELFHFFIVRKVISNIAIFFSKRDFDLSSGEFVLATALCSASFDALDQPPVFSLLYRLSGVSAFPNAHHDLW